MGASARQDDPMLRLQYYRETGQDGEAKLYEQYLRETGQYQDAGGGAALDRLHAAYKSGRLQKNIADKNAAERIGVGDYLKDQAAGLAAAAASIGRDIPGIEAVQVGARAVTRGQSYRDALSDIRQSEEEIPIASGALRLAGAGLAGAAMPGGAAALEGSAVPALAKVGALFAKSVPLQAATYGAALGATDANPDAGLADRAKNSALQAALGATTARAAELGMTALRSRGAKTLARNLLDRDAARTADAGAAFDRFRAAGDLGSSPALENVIGGTRQVPVEAAVGARGESGALRSLSRVSDADLAAEYRRLIDANATDEATRAGWHDNPAYMERHELLGGGHIEDARGVSGYDADAARAAGMAKARVNAREQSISAIEQEIERRGLAQGDALNPDGGLGSQITGGATRTERVRGVGIIEDAMRAARKENSALRDAAPSDARLLARTYQIANDRSWQKANGYSSGVGVEELANAIEPLANAKGVSLREANAAYSIPSGEMDFVNRGAAALRNTAKPKGTPITKVATESPEALFDALPAATDAERAAAVEGVLGELKRQPKAARALWGKVPLPVPSTAFWKAPGLLRQIEGRSALDDAIQALLGAGASTSNPLNP